MHEVARMRRTASLTSLGPHNRPILGRNSSRSPPTGCSMPMDPQHLRRHLQDLRERISFLRPLQPDSPSYRLWLGDVIELVNVQWGLQSRQMLQLRAAIGRGGRQPEAESHEERVRAYLARLDDLDAVLESFVRATIEPVQFFE
jgi:hypothetical protein